MERRLPEIPTTELASRLRRHVVEMTSAGDSSHVGSCLGCADIVAVLYGQVLRIYEDPSDELRDRFIMSKGHAGAVVYAALAEVGYFETEVLLTHCGDGSMLSGHVSADVPGVEVSTGALGHGLSIAAGMADGLRQGNRGSRVFALLSEGDCNEGATWEAAMYSSHRGLSNLTAIVDNNNLQSLGTVADTMELEPFADKWRAFGWEVIEVDGHHHGQLIAALTTSPVRPLCVIAKTTKGCGVSFMENSVLWHYRSPQGDELDRARAELASS